MADSRDRPIKIDPRSSGRLVTYSDNEAGDRSVTNIIGGDSISKTKTGVPNKIKYYYENPPTITFIGSGSNTSTNGGLNFRLNVPSAVVDNDLILMMVSSYGNNPNAKPAGTWQALDVATQSTFGAVGTPADFEWDNFTTIYGNIYYRFANSEPPYYELSRSVGFDRFVAAVVVYRNVDKNNPFYDIEVTKSGSSGAENYGPHHLHGVTSSVNVTNIFMYNQYYTDQTITGTESGYTFRMNADMSVNGFKFVIGDKVSTTAGPTGDIVLTTNEFGSDWWSFVAALRLTGSA